MSLRYRHSSSDELDAREAFLSRDAKHQADQAGYQTLGHNLLLLDDATSLQPPKYPTVTPFLVTGLGSFDLDEG
jgi:hypothetical protein